MKRIVLTDRNEIDQTCLLLQLADIPFSMAPVTVRRRITLHPDFQKFFQPPTRNRYERKAAFARRVERNSRAMSGITHYLVTGIKFTVK